MESAFAAADILSLEVNPSEEKLAAVQAMVMRDGTYPAGESLASHLSPETFRLTQEAFKRYGLAIDPMIKFRPWVIASTIQALALQKIGYDANLGIDRYFAKRAAPRPIIELESFEYQLALLNGLDEKEQELFLLSTVLEMERLPAMMDELVKAWRAGETGVIEKCMTEDLLQYPELASVYEKLYTRRNREMAKKVEGYLKSGHTHLVVVGALHLVGGQGLVGLLREKGYKVEQL
jgi:uncharacterized protein YbaP (TraB family)